MSCTQITVEELKRKLFSPDKFQLIDVRNVDEYREGHIEGSVLIPLDVLPYKLNDLNKSGEVIVVCRSGSRSSQACQLLQEHGFYQVKSLNGGLISWSA